ncbi:MAG TPA: hypothetical protein VNS12_07730 [Pelagibacterium sp.]|uniref:DUF883 family protein n=1 Tax=Pelagibacterium sp. TaxID=1967288 RepID=UPI002CC5F3E1|nr:hypothetical protein [Pelagibacterium sp.]HWJ87942.1 hypothetical protein [Pelagibacterium sp.]
MARAATPTSRNNENGDDAANDLNAEIAALREDIASITATLGDVVKNRAGDAKDEAVRIGKKMERKGEEALESVQDSFESAESDLKAAIRERPISSVLIAAGVGYIISKIM